MSVGPSVSSSGPPPPSPQQIEAALLRTMGEGVRMIATEARNRAAVKTGAMRRSISEEGPRLNGGVVEGSVAIGGPGAPYALAQDSGSGLYGPKHAKYVILPKKPGGVLAWPGPHMGPPGGAYRTLSGNFRAHIKRHIASGAFPISEAFTFAKKVHHPGVKPTEFATGAINDLWPKVVEMAATAIERLTGSPSA